MKTATKCPAECPRAPVKQKYLHLLTQSHQTSFALFTSLDKAPFCDITKQKIELLQTKMGAF